MAKETTVEVDIEVSTKYTEKMKKAEERLKKVNKVASKMNAPKKPLTEMEKYQQGVDRTYKLLQKLEKQQRNLSKSIEIQTILKAKIRIDIKQKDLYLKKAELTNDTKLSSINAKLDGINRGTNDEKDKKTTKQVTGSSDTVDAVFAAIGSIASLFGPVGKAIGGGLVAGQKLGKVMNKLEDYILEKVAGERITKIRYSNGLRLDTINRISESENIKTGEITKYYWIGKGSESYNPNTGEKRSTNWLGNKKMSYNPNTKIEIKYNGLGNKKTLYDSNSKVQTNYNWLGNKKSSYDLNTGVQTNYNRLGEVKSHKRRESLSIESSIGDAIFKSGITKNFDAITKLGEMLNAAANASSNTVEGSINGLSGTVTNAYSEMIEMINMKLTLIQTTSVMNIELLKLLWDGYFLKVNEIYDNIVIMISMKFLLIQNLSMIAILQIYLLWSILPIQIEGIWQQILSGADVFLSSLKAKFTTTIAEIKQQMAEISSVSINIPSSGKGPGNTYTGSNFWRGGLTYVGERGRELIQYPTGERFMADAKMLMNLPKGTKIFRNFMTERIMNNGFSGSNIMTTDENNQLKKLGGFNGLSDYTNFKFGGGSNYSSVQANNITINITNTYGNQSTAQIKDTNNDLVRKINEVLFQKEDRKRRVSIG